MQLKSLGAVMGALLFSAVGLSAQTASDVAPDAGLAPILRGAPDAGLPGEVAGTERWIVHFEKRNFDLRAFRDAVRQNVHPQVVAGIVADLETKAVNDQRPFELALQKLGGRVVVQWWLVNACAIEIRPEILNGVRALPNVAMVQPETAHEVLIKTSTNASNHNSDYVNNTLNQKGLGVTAGIMDTGQDENMGGSGRPHRTYFVNGDINNKSGGGIGGSRLLVNRQIGALSQDDQHGHGTGVASISAGANWGTSSADDGHAPVAGIAGYAIANQVSGGSSSNTVMASAWQSMAADKVQYKIVSANLSYGGSPNPLDVAQKALDSAVLNADIMVCVAAGNSSSSTQGSQSAVNGLAVGAVNTNSHTVASFSSRGPLSGDTQRFYPDIAACGVSTVMARRDNEGSDYTGSGTSMASPQVCGAATLLRGAYTSISALETKSILLASTFDISEKNPSAPYNTRNAYGMGLLRDDRAFELTKANQFGTAKLDSSSPVWLQSISVKQNQTYSIAVSWHRTDVNSSQWSNLKLEVLDGSTVIAASDTPRNLYEMVRVFNRTATTLTLRVSGSLSGTSQDFSYAYMEAPNSKQDGVFATYGAGCVGTGKKPATCMSMNTSGSLRGATGYPSVTYLLEVRPTTNLSVKGFSIKLDSGGSSTVVIPTYLYSSSSGRPNQVLASGTMSVGASEALYSTALNTTVNLAANQLYFIGFRNASSTITVGTMTVGGSVATVPYWRNNGTGGAGCALRPAAGATRSNAAAVRARSRPSPTTACPRSTPASASISATRRRVPRRCSGPASATAAGAASRCLWT
jgi:hypothetical protein